MHAFAMSYTERPQEKAGRSGNSAMRVFRRISREAAANLRREQGDAVAAVGPHPETIAYFGGNGAPPE